MNPDLLKIVQGLKDAEGLSLGAVVQKVEQIRASDLKTKEDVKKVAQALVALRKEVKDIPLDNEVKKLQKAISDAEKRISDAHGKDIEAVKQDLRQTETKLRQEIDDKIPDVVTITERVNEIEKALTDEDYAKVMQKIREDEDTAKAMRDFFEGFEGDDRLDASAIKNLPQGQTINAGGGSNLSVFSNGSLVGSSTRVNFTGATVSNEGGRIKVAVGGGASALGDLTDVDVSDTTTNHVLTRKADGTFEMAAPPGASGGEANTASNLGTGEGVYTSKVGVDLRFKSLIGGTGITLSSDANEITIDRDALAASDITDFDTEVSNNTDVAANTSARHAAVTVTDSSEINFTLTGQDITASLVAGSIDETKLDTSVNASLDLADSAVQPADLADYQKVEEVNAASKTAELNTFYVNVATSTYTDPSPSEGRGFTVFVRNATATVGGTGYSTAGTVIRRIYHSGSWSNYVYNVSSTFANASHTHATSDITSGTFADARIAQSNVTQHQSALTIAQSQVTSLVSDLAAKAPTASPTFTGTTTIPRLDYNQAIAEYSNIGNLGTSETLDWSTARVFTGTLDQSSCTFTFSNVVVGDIKRIRLTGSASTSSITLPGTITWMDNNNGSAPAVPGDGEVLSITIESTGSGTYDASATGNYAVYS